MTSQIQVENPDRIQEYREPDSTFRINEKDIDGKIENLESIEQAITHILSTERYSNPIYGDDYGVELEKYIGQDIGLLIADIEVTLNEALTQDDRITNVIVTSITQPDSSSCLVKFIVTTIYGELKEEKNVLL